AGLEEIDVNPLAGADTVNVDDLSGTDVREINLTLGGPAGRTAGNAQADSIIVNGTSGADFIPVLGTAGGILVNGDFITRHGLPYFMAIRGVLPTDALRINGNGGDDDIEANDLGTPVMLIADGGDGNDTLIGSPGNDMLLGGNGDDFIDGKGGNDVASLGAGTDLFQWDPGDGSDTVDGQGGADRLVFNGSDDPENIGLSANGNRVRLTRDRGGVAMDLGDVEEVDFHVLGGSDTITVNDLSGTGLSAVKLDLAGTRGGGDGQADSVVVNATEGNDNIQVLAASNGM